jgi:hypothetical protein
MVVVVTCFRCCGKVVLGVLPVVPAVVAVVAVAEVLGDEQPANNAVETRAADIRAQGADAPARARIKS